MSDTSTRFAVVTGGNRGIGLETCRQLAASGYRVLIGCRDGSRGRAVAAELAAEIDAQVTAAPLDVTSADSVAQFSAHVGELGAPIDALVNNAGVALDGFDLGVVERTLAVNYEGPAKLTDALRPLLAPSARIVMVSSGIGELAGLPLSLRARFEDDGLDRAGLEALLGEFREAVASGRHQALGWPSSAYRVSKAALNALTRVLANELADSQLHVIAVCPGWVRTDMGGDSAPRLVAEGARGVVWAATLPPDGPRVGFFRDSARIPW